MLGRLTLLLLLVLASTARAGGVPINAFQQPGDIHVTFPTYTEQGVSDPYAANPPQAMVHEVGDVNGDGRADIGMAISEPGGNATVWITFSPAGDPISLQADAADFPGVKITGLPSLTSGLAGVGDINGDGLGDIAVSALSTAYVVYGRAQPGTVDLTNLGKAGFKLTGVDSCPASSSGNGFTGIFARGSSVSRIPGGIAICGWSDVLTFFPPADAAGQTFDLSQTRADTGRLHVDYATNPALGVRSDGMLVIGWAEDDAGHILTVAPPAAGEERTLDAARADPDASELDFPAGQLEQVTPVGDFNGDGIGDVAVSLVTFPDRRRFVAFDPGKGHRATVSEANSLPAEEIYSGITDVGDQDGDGRPDLAYDSQIKLSAANDWIGIDETLPGGCVTLVQFNSSSSLVLCSLEHKIAEALPDTNGDGKPELVAIHASPLPIENGVSYTTWSLDVFPSATRPVVKDVEAPVQNGTAFAFAATFLTAPAGKTRSLAALPTVQVTDAAGRVRSVAGQLLDAGATPSTRAVVATSASALGLIAGQTYTSRVTLENGRGLSATTPPRVFTYTGPAVKPTPVPTAKKHRKKRRGKRIIGTRHRDRLHGTRYADVLMGRRGRDHLFGGRGNDVLDGGPGRDVLDCGRGRDTAIVDHIDRVKHCERIRPAR